MAESNFKVVANTPAFVVVSKPIGVSFHSESGQPGFFEQVKQDLGLSQLYPVHRLDKVTSGLLVMAKTAEANTALCEAFKMRRVDKFYLAISAKKPNKKQGAIIGDMAPSRRGSFKLLATRQNPAVTQFFTAPLAEGRRLFALKPHTGKTHQLRVALKSLGAAILGDPLYSDGQQPSDRTYLHAYYLRFPLEGEVFEFMNAPDVGHYFTDDVFLAALHSLGDLTQLPWPNLPFNLRPNSESEL